MQGSRSSQLRNRLPIARQRKGDEQRADAAHGQELRAHHFKARAVKEDALRCGHEVLRGLVACSSRAGRQARPRATGQTEGKQG